VQIASLTVDPVSAATVGGKAYASSTKLGATWTTASSDNPDYWELVAVSSSGHRVVQRIDSPQDRTATIASLRSSSSYEVTLSACAGTSTCQPITTATASGSTAEETWQLRGTGHSADDAETVAADSNTLAYVFRYGNDADPALAGKLRLYYKPFPAQFLPPPSYGAPGLRVGLSTTAGTTSPTYEIASGYGLDSPNPPGEQIVSILAFQAVPMIPGDRVRLFFEAGDDIGGKATVRYYSLDSQDGLMGRDFAKGDTTLPNKGEDYNPGGSAEPTLVLGAHGDALKGDSGLTNIRQSKMGWPLLDSWAWDGAAGAFLVITGSDACGKTKNGLFYATYDGSDWNVIKDQSGCATRMVDYGHGPVVVHLGGSRYKLYYEDELNATNHSGKPLRLVYADGSTTGDPKHVELDDWEPSSAAREVRFLWPDGTDVDVQSESGFGDHVIFMPTGSTDQQVMHMNLSGMDNANQPRASVGVGTANLINP
jgi:hypothetical protein